MDGKKGLGTEGLGTRIARVGVWRVVIKGLGFVTAFIVRALGK